MDVEGYTFEGPSIEAVTASIVISMFFFGSLKGESVCEHPKSQTPSLNLECGVSGARELKHDGPPDGSGSREATNENSS